MALQGIKNARQLKGRNILITHRVKCGIGDGFHTVIHKYHFHVFGYHVKKGKCMLDCFGYSEGAPMSSIRTIISLSDAIEYGELIPNTESRVRQA